MRMNQYVYFVLGSETVTAEDITARLGVEADEVTVRGSERTDPVRPFEHAWKIVCRTPGLDLESLISPVLGRVAPVATQIRQLVDTGDVWAMLQIVRYFNDEHGHPEEFVTRYEDGHTLEKMPGQHQMLGWALEPKTLELLVSMNATIDVDEYSWPMTMRFDYPAEG